MTLHSNCWFGEPCHVGRPEDCPPAIAAASRNAGSPWDQLETQRECGGLRHYLSGTAVHCGNILTLQAIETRYDDYGSWLVYLERGTTVRYEAAFHDQAIRATVHTMVGGHEFVARLEAWMRFTWRVA